MDVLLWQVDKQQPGVYVPQLGDEVVYLREGHAKFLADTADKRRPPWETLVPTEVRLYACGSMQMVHIGCFVHPTFEYCAVDCDWFALRQTFNTLPC